MTVSKRFGRIPRHGYTTDSGLLSRMAEQQEAAWIEFDAKYRRMICTVGQKRGIAPEDCEDLVQEVMLVCCRRIGSFFYDRSRGHFRSFLIAVIQNISWQMLRKKKPAPDIPPDYDVSLDLEFMREYEAFLLDALLESLRKRVSSSTYSAFEMLWIQQMPVEEVSRITRKSAGALYLIRHRCLRILRQSAAEIPEAVDRIHHKGISTKKA